MHADLSPALLEVGPGETCVMSVRITNTTSVIDAYQVSVFGLDPTWVEVDQHRLSLFPSEAGDVSVSITLPESFPAGHRQLSVHVRSENDPASFALSPIGLLALGQQRLSMRVDPALITAGKEANFGVVVSNDGNTTISAVVSAIEPEELVDIRLTPATLELLPGHQEVVQARIIGKRPWLGAPKVRMITFSVDATTHTEAIGTFLQKPRIGRWVLSLMGLLAAAAVFAVVLSRTFDNVVKESTVDKGLLTSALDKGGTGGQTVAVNAAVVSGKVVLFSTHEGVAGVQAELFNSGDTKVPVATAATAEGGVYSFGGLNGGKYKIRFSGAGFSELWYESGATAADATEVTVELGKVAELSDVELGGRPGSIAGTVEAADLTNITASLVVPGTASDSTDAEVRSISVSADGTFLFENVPSPASYQLIVAKAGYATETRDVALGAAQSVDGIAIVLRKGDGVIRGHVNDAAGVLGGASIEATDGTTKLSTVSLTDGDVGSFAVRALTTPQIYTLTITREGYTTETRTVSLTAAQDFDLGTITLQRNTGSVTGTVTLVGGGPIGGVGVTISAGTTNITTFTASTGDVGTFYVDELPMPATYTLTFAKAGYVSQVRVQDLDPVAGTADAIGIDVALVGDTAIVQGVIRGVDNSPVAGAAVELSDGTTVRKLITANDPLGRFTFSGVQPGAYTLTASLTGSSQAVVLINVAANDNLDKDIRLDAQASATGQVLLLNSATGIYEPYVGAIVRLFLTANFPGPPANAALTQTTDLNGNYTFSALDAPQNYVVAVYQTELSPDPLDSQLILTQPSTSLTVPTFQIPVLF